MSKKEFKNIPIKKPVMQDSPVSVPDELNTVDIKPVKVKLNVSDIVNIILAFLRNKAIEELEPKKTFKFSKYLFYGFIILLVVLLVVIL